MTDEHRRSERERRELAQAMKDSPDWAVEPIARVLPRRRLDHMVSLRLGAEEFAELAEVARANGISVSSLIRRAALVAARSDHTTCGPACPIHGSVTVSIKH